MDNGLDNTDVREDQGSCSTMTVVVPEWYKTSWNLVKMIPNYMRLLLESK